MNPKTAGATLVALALALVLAGCGGGADDPSTQEPAADGPPTSTGATEAPEPTEGPGTSPEGSLEFESTTDGESVDPEGPQDLMLADVRVGEHDDFDRLVLEFSGEGKPGWSVHYVDRPRQDGSGKVIRLAGDVFLDIYARGTTPRMEGVDDGEWDVYAGPARLRPRGSAIEAVHIAEGPFEGDHQVLVGVNGTWDPFRVFALDGPPRLVVDLRHPEDG